MSELYDKPLLTLSLLRGWQERESELVTSMHKMGEEVLSLRRKIEAAKVIMGDGPDSPPIPEAASATSSAPATEESDSLAEMVLNAVAALGNSPKPAEIRQWIVQHSPILGERLEVNANYFYTVLGRHLRKGRLVKDGSGYRRPANSPQGETGAVAAPASSS
jgi:hypothetical protein